MPVAPSASEDVTSWVQAGSTGRMPVDFLYGDRRFSDFQDRWKRRDELIDQGGQDIVVRTTFSEPDQGLVVEIDTVQLPASGAVEWVARLRNSGTTRSPILSEIMALDARLSRDGLPVVLRRSHGSAAQRRDFEAVPYEPTNWQDHEPSPFWTAGEPIRDSEEVTFGSVGGRSSNGHLPFFDLQAQDRGVTVGIGWSGQWEAHVSVPDVVTYHVRAGMPGCHLALEPGEEIRTPRILLHFWRGSLIDAHNQFRRLLLQRYTPWIAGEPVVAPIAASSFAFFPEVSLDTPMATMGTGVTESNQIELLRAYIDKDLPIDVFWMDAGWYDNPGTWRHGVGNWYPNPRTFQTDCDRSPTRSMPPASASWCGLSRNEWSWARRSTVIIRGG